jgi:putative DNA methylase
MQTNRRLIETAFPLQQTSLSGAHEKMCHSGHPKAFHIWPARRPLAACRAALIATLLPDPGDADKRNELCEKIAGKVVKKIERKKMPNGETVERIKEETQGGILEWGTETENAEMLEWFRQEIRKAYGGRAPRVLDPFAGGGAIPLEAMRLGCEATAVDINPVAWFILKCTLEYPQKLAGQMRPLPEFILHNDAFMSEFFKKAKGYGKADIKAALKRLHERVQKKPKWNQKAEQASFRFQQDDDDGGNDLQAGFAWHVRAWAQWVLDRARRDLLQHYPTYADFEPVTKDQIAYEHQPTRLVSHKDDGTLDVDSLNADFTQEYLDDKRNPRWVTKPTLTYLWARTVACKNCRAAVPLLKTRWICKKANKRVLLTMQPNSAQTGVTFGVEVNVAAKGGNAAQRREHDIRISAGTMSRSGAKCPCCGAIMTMSDLRLEGMNNALGETLLCLVRGGASGKEYLSPTSHDHAALASLDVSKHFIDLPFGIPDEPLPSKESLGSRIPLYGFGKWSQMFSTRQLCALGCLATHVRSASGVIATLYDDRVWSQALLSFLACIFNKVADYNSAFVPWQPKGEKGANTFQRWAFPMKWDYAENNLLVSDSGGWLAVSEWVTTPFMANLRNIGVGTVSPHVVLSSATCIKDRFDVILTDPPYYDAIPYSDLMDFFYVWLRRTIGGLGIFDDDVFDSDLGPKWNHEQQDGELIDEASRFKGDHAASRKAYEDGMSRVFCACWQALEDDGRLVIVFAHKEAEAWETLVSAIIRAGFVVDGSWPIQTEMNNRTRAMSSAALASSVWLVCKKRPLTAKPGWDNNVLEEMRLNIAVKLREFWDAGIRGPDFVWAATGPAMEAYSKHPVVRKANAPGEVMDVGEFLNHVRRMVVDYIVGQVLTGEHGADLSAANRLDEVSAYYLLHRHDFGLEDAPVGACILYATACGLSDTELDKTWDVLIHAGSQASSLDDIDESDNTDDEEESETTDDTSSGSNVKLKPWSQRQSKNVGHEAPDGKAVPLIDRIHRVMHLWKDGDLQKVDDFLDQHALRRNELFKRVVQSLIELSTDNERSLLESISNHIGSKGAIRDRGPSLPFGEDELT